MNVKRKLDDTSQVVKYISKRYCSSGETKTEKGQYWSDEDEPSLF